jgi:Cd2+/Zn2+-exporting ATPase
MFGNQLTGSAAPAQGNRPMTDRLTTEKYHVGNLDCASCAAKLEAGLKQVDGVMDAVVDFANLTLHVQAKDMNRVLENARRIEPDIILVPHGDPSAVQAQRQMVEGINLKKELVLLTVAAVLFLWQMLFEDWFHQRQWLVLELAVVLVAYLLVGWNVLAAAWRTVNRGNLFDENVLMVIATVGAMAIHAFSEAVAVMIFYKIGEMLQETAVNRSRRSIRALLAAKPNQAAVKTPQGVHHVPPETVNVDDIILVKPGEKIPLDGEVIEGRSLVDTSILTGEPAPISAKPGKTVLAGQISKTGALTLRVTRLFKETSIARVMDLVENATARKAKTEKFITSFARYYTPAVVVAAAIIAFVPPLITQDDFQIWIYRALVLLVISCPCALVISIPLGYFGGIGRASKEGILVKGSNFIDALAGIKAVIFDKTGTLTRGVFQVNEVVNRNGFSKYQLLELAAAAEYQSNHPIAVSILSALKHRGGKVDTTMLNGHTDIPGQGVKVHYGDRTIYVGNDALLHTVNVEHGQCQFDSTVAHIVVDGIYAGYLAIGDELRPESLKAVNDLRAAGISDVIMLTGDNHCAARSISRKLGLDGFHSDLLPENKVGVYEQIEAQYADRHKIAFVGDGINDAPVIARADVGMAMGGMGSDAAVEVADVVFMKDSPAKIVQAIEIAKQTRRIVWQNIILAFTVKGIFIIFGALGMATMWEAVFADMGTALLAVANSTRVLHSSRTTARQTIINDMPAVDRR